MGLAVDEVVHHHNVVGHVVVWTWRASACDDPHTCDPGVVELDPKERKTAITRRGRHKTAEQQPAVGTEKLHQRARSAIATLVARTTAIRLIDVSEDHAKTGNNHTNLPI